MDLVQKQMICVKLQSFVLMLSCKDSVQSMLRGPWKPLVKQLSQNHPEICVFQNGTNSFR